jgi:uncharacterized protein (DUF2236 family)
MQSTTLVYQALVKDVSLAERNAYCEAGAGLAIELGAHAGEVPRDWASLERYMAGVHAAGTLVVGPAARDLAHALLFGGFARLVGPIGAINKRLTLGWLPPDIRDQYGVPWGPIDDRKADRWRARLRGLRRRLPDAIALWPEARRR